MKPAYYNEHEPFCAAWLRNLIAAGHIPAGDVDERDIRAVQPDDLAGYGQKHLFGGVGGWAYACRLAGYPDDADILTGSPPCQPFSVAGRQAGVADDRHLWPEMARLAASLRPAHVAVENVANIVGMALDGMLADLETAGFCARAFVIPACAVDAPHRRDRLWIAAKALDDADDAQRRPDRAGGHQRDRQATGRLQGDGDARQRGGDGGGPVADADRAPPNAYAEAGSSRRPVGQSGGGAVEHAAGERRGEGRAEPDFRGGRATAPGAGGAGAVADAERDGSQGREPAPGAAHAGGRRSAEQGGGFWDDAGWIAGRDGKARRVPQSGARGLDAGLPAGMAGVRPIPLLAQGVPERVGKLRALGNAICPQVAAEILKAMRCA